MPGSDPPDVDPATRSDYVDSLVDLLAQWHPDDMLRPKALAYRLRRIAHHLETAIRRDLAHHGIELWELELLACLIRAPHGQLSPGALASQMQLTSGGVTNRISRLESKGWITRDIDRADRRSIVVTLTPEGADRANHVFKVKTDAEVELLSALTANEQDDLNDTLRTLLISFERTDG